jgi:hypothetical protein
MNNRLIISILMFRCVTAFSQKDSILMQRLTKPILNCEVIATNAQALLPAYTLEQWDSIAPICAIWQKTCGEIEPIQRIQILFDIHANRLIDSNYKKYMQFFIYDYKNRIADTKLENYNQIFEYYKTRFNFVPMGGAFDAWTKAIAQQLLPKQVKGTTQYLFCLLFCNEFERYEQEIQQESYTNSPMPQKTDLTYDWNPGFSISLMGGMWVPTGSLKQHFENSPQLGVQIGMPLRPTLKVGVVFNICKFYDPKPLEINVENVITKVNPISNGTFGIWLAKEWGFKKGFFIDGLCGLAVTNLQTDLKKINPTDKNDSNYSISTADFSLGMQFRKNILKKRGIGIQCSYHFVPYHWNQLLKTNLGNSYLAVQLMYRIQS